MRQTVTHRRPHPIVFALLFGHLLLFGGLGLSGLMHAGLWKGRGAPFGVAIPGALLLLCGFVVWLALSAPSRTTIETDSKDRVLRIGRETLFGPKQGVYPYDDICEVRLCRGKGEACQLSIFTRSGGWSSSGEFAREAAARDVARRLAAEIGCLTCEEAFPFDYETERGVPIVLGMVLYLTVVYPIDQGVAPLAVVGLVLCSAFALWAWVRGPACYVRIDQGRCMLVVLRRRGFGVVTSKHPFEDIAEIVAETVDPGEPHPSYGVRIVLGADALLDAFRESVESVGDTLFESTNRQSVRSTAARLARRIGRPWRDATEPPPAAE